MALIVETTIICILLFLIYWGYEIYSKNQLLKDVPGPVPIPFIGLLNLPTNPYEIPDFFNNMVQKYGKTIKYYMGPTLTIGTLDVDFLEQICKSTEHITKSDLYDMFRPLMKDGLVLKTGESWKQRRKLMTPSFHLSILKEFFKSFKAISERFILLLNQAEGKGTTIDFEDYMTRFAYVALAETVLGLKVDIFKAEDVPYVNNVKTLLRTSYLRNFSIWKRFDVLFRLFANEYGEYTQALKTFHGITKEIIESKRKEYTNFSIKQDDEEEIKNRAILIETLMTHQELSNEDIHDELSGIIVGGFETTATVASFAIYELANHPQIQEKLYNEIKNVVNGDIKELTYEKLEEIKYLEQVVKETMRLRPTAPLIERKIQTKFQFGKTFVPSGTVISMLIYYVHLNPKYHPDPYQFNPERFSSVNQGKMHPYSYLPFSAGPRNCIGQKFSMTEIKTVLSRIVMEYKILPVEGFKLELGFSGTLKSKHGLPVKLQRRINN